MMSSLAFFDSSLPFRYLCLRVFQKPTLLFYKYATEKKRHDMIVRLGSERVIHTNTDTQSRHD